MWCKQWGAEIVAAPPLHSSARLQGHAKITFNTHTHTHAQPIMHTGKKWQTGQFEQQRDPQSQPARTQQWVPLFQDAAFSGAPVKSSQLCASEHQDGLNYHIDARFPRLVSVRRPVRLRDHGGTEWDNGIGLKGAVCQGKDEVVRGEGGRISS